MLSSERITEEVEDKSTNKPGVFVLFVVGFLIVLLGIMLLSVAVLISGVSASYGGVIFIGPIPIVFGAGPQAIWLILFAIVLAALSIAIFVLIRGRMEKAVLSIPASLLCHRICPRTPKRGPRMLQP